MLANKILELKKKAKKRNEKKDRKDNKKRILSI